MQIRSGGLYCRDFRFIWRKLQQPVQLVRCCMDLEGSRTCSVEQIDASFLVDTFSSTNSFAAALRGSSCKGYEWRLGRV